MEITIRLLASYRQYLPKHHDDRAGYCQRVAPGSRVADVLRDLPIPPGEAYTVLINGRHATRDQPLHAGDVLSVFPAVGGG
jgi:molybdopterin synthase sulfur carrier subunit